ncbi:MAG TPA: hypothetical protein VIL45_07035 [Thermoplasmata archaeon]
MLPDFARFDEYPGIAFSIRDHVQTWDPYLAIVEDEDGNEYEEETGEGEWVDDPSRVVARMVGDDRDYTFGVDDIRPLHEEEFCPGCGQIGCGHGRL